MTSKVISDIVEQDLCTGCGICVGSSNENNNLQMEWNTEGFYVPKVSNQNYIGDNTEVEVCPFNPNPKEDRKDEDILAQDFLANAPKYHQKLGKYENLYVGYSEKYRLTSSSGGTATYVFDQLFKRKEVSAILVVQEGKNSAYEYGIIHSVDEIIKSSKTRYYPVTMAGVISKIKEIDGEVAIVGVGCFIKGIRLLQKQDEYYRKKIKFLIGIICGGLKSKYYANYLASRSTDIRQDDIKKPQYRIKKENHPASDYFFSSEIKDKEVELQMKQVGDMWGTGLFKSNACDLCEDVACELPDISLGDAWLKPYVEDWQGNNVIITRTKLADTIINEGIANSDLVMNDLPEDDFIKSQSGSYNHRQDGLQYRMKLLKRKGAHLPPKREKTLTGIPLLFKLIQYLRMLVRKKSLQYWVGSDSLKEYQRKLTPVLFLLKGFTVIRRKFKK